MWWKTKKEGNTACSGERRRIGEKKKERDREIPISLKISKKVCVYLTRGIDTTVALKQIFSLGIKKW